MPLTRRLPPSLRNVLALLATAALAIAALLLPASAATDLSLLSTVFREHGTAMLFIDPDSGRIVDANAAAGKLYGYPVERLIGRRIEEFNVLDATEVAAERRRAQAEARNYFLFPHRLAGGTVRTVEVYSSPVVLADGHRVLFSLIHEASSKTLNDGELLAYKTRLEELVQLRTRELDTAQQHTRSVLLGAIAIQSVIIVLLLVSNLHRRRAAQSLARREEQLSTLINAMPDIVCFKDGSGRWQEANAFTRTLFGLDNVDFRGKTDTELAPPGHFLHDALAACARSDQQALAGTASVRCEETIPLADGNARIFDIIKVPLFNPDRSRRGLVVIGRDITDSKAAESEIERLAYFDPLTNLPNRRLLLDRLSNTLSAARRSGRHGAILLVDLDYFKTLNEARGHEMGDRLLEAVAKRLTACMREADTVCRFGGDEFVLLLPELAAHPAHAADLARAVAEQIRATIAAPYPMDAEEVSVGASIGVTLIPNSQAASIADLLKQAETAMYQAKDAGRNAVRFFEPEMQERVEARFALEGELRHAIERGQLRLYLQPQVDRDGTIVAAEALLRWQHPERGLVAPAHFIPLAEENGFIVALGNWALRESCRLLVAAERAQITLRLAVNVSPRQFHQAGFVATVREILADTGADPGKLTLEITEGLVIDRVHQTVATMTELRTLGIHFSIDDFGTGYSSMAYLKRLPINELKIDRAFIQDAPTDPNDAALIDAILAVAKHLRLAVVAEGVETAEQAAFLDQRSPMLYQGYLFGRPEPAEKLFERLIRERELC